MYQLPALQNFSNLIHGFSDKSDGNMSFRWGERGEALSNRRRFLGDLGIAPRDVAAMYVNHGTEILFVDGSYRGKEAIEVDCLITKSRNVFLLVLTADCSPIVLYDPVEETVGLVHLSRINAQLAFIRKVIERFRKAGSKPENIFVAIGPSARKDSYVFAEKELEKRLGEGSGLRDFLFDLPDGMKGIDLVGFNIAELVSAGVLRQNIKMADKDTIADENFFSHYRSRKTGEPEGRMATVVGITNRSVNSSNPRDLENKS